MQHHSQHPAQGNQHPAKGIQALKDGPQAGTTGIIASHIVISGEEIERHIAAGKRLQAEAIGAFLRGGLRRLTGVFRRPSREGPSAGGAVPHRI